MKVSLFLLIGMALGGCDKVGAQSNNVRVELDGQALSIPAKYLLPSLPSTLVPRGQELDRDVGILLEIPMKDLGMRAERASGSSDNVLALVLPVQGKNTDLIRPDAIESWHAEGLYQDSVVELDDKAGMYRVYPKAGYPLIWQYFRRVPSEGADPVVNWVASCNSPPGSAGDDLSLATCKSIVVVESFKSEISYTAEYVGRIDLLREKYTALFSDWIL